MFENFPIVKFLIIWIPFTIIMFIFAPGLKYKLLFPVAGAVGVWLALAGKSMKGMTPLGRKF